MTKSLKKPLLLINILFFCALLTFVDLNNSFSLITVGIGEAVFDKMDELVSTTLFHNHANHSREEFLTLDISISTGGFYTKKKKI